MAFILAGLLGLFYAALGLEFLLSPAGGAQLFGVDPSHMADLALAPALGSRELALGLIVLVLAARRQASACGTVLLIGSIAPIADFAVAGKAFGYAPALRHLATAPVSLILGLVLVGR